MQQTIILILGLSLICSLKGQSTEYVERQLLCALDQGPCDAWGRQIKAALPEIIGRRCQNCNRSQLNNATRVARFVQTRYPDLWAAIVEKYSQDEYYDDRQETFLWNRNILF